MNIYSFIPLVATLAYIPLLITTGSARPWTRRHKLFMLLLLVAALWSLMDYIWRSNYFPSAASVISRIVIFLFVLMAVQFHYFSSSFFPADKGRWVAFAYGSLICISIPLILGYIPQTLTQTNGNYYAEYGYWVFFIATPLIALLARNLYIHIPRLKNQENPIIYNQTISLVICISVLSFFMILSIFPMGRVFPISHLGNIASALILSHAVVSHQLVDIRFVLRRGFIWASISIIGISSYIALLLVFHAILGTELSPISMFFAVISGIISVVLIYKLRDLISHFMGKAFQGESFSYRQKLEEFADKIHRVFNLEDQGVELLLLVTHAVNCGKAGLLFIDTGEDYITRLVEPSSEENTLSKMSLKRDSPIVEFLKRERRPLTRDNLAILPEFLGLWKQEKDLIEENEIELLVPLISRDNLIGILVLDKKKNGHYNLEDFNLLDDISKRVAVSMEKEYLREQLKVREEELSVINRSNAIITESFDIQMIYDKFIKELKKGVDVDWASIAVIEGDEIYFMALSSDIGSPWKVGERIPLKGTATEWVASRRKSYLIPDLALDTQFTTGKYHLQHSIRSIAYIPLTNFNRVIGTLTVASRKPDVYGSRQLKLLEQLAGQISMPIENSLLYRRTDHMARYDSLTGLLNRRSLDEIFPSEIGRHSRYGGEFSMIIMDLDSFKYLNDNYGHLAGDELLRNLGGIIKNTIREADQAFRYGGDEFAILLPQSSMDAAFKVAERIRHQTYAGIEIGSKPITISLGLATWPADGVTPKDIIAAADNALYQSKRSGGNQTRCSSVNLKAAIDSKNSPSGSQDSGTLSTIFALAATVDTRDRLTHDHSKKVHDIAIAIAEGMGLDALEINRLGTCALLHDIGKIGINDEVLQKQGKLTDMEWKMIKAHPALGSSIISHSLQLAPCIQGILHHHERFNGEGYPDGLKGAEIPLEARILAIADSFAAMTSARVYSKTLSCDEAIEEIKRASGNQFDPALVDIFVKVVPKINKVSGVESPNTQTINPV